MSLDSDGHPEQAGLKMAQISNMGGDSYVMGIRPQMELEISTDWHYVHIIVANLNSYGKEIFYARVSPDATTGTTTHLQQISSYHNKAIGIEAAWVGASVTGTVGDSGVGQFTGYQSFWTGTKEKLDYGGHPGDDDLHEHTFIVSSALEDRSI